MDEVATSANFSSFFYPIPKFPYAKGACAPCWIPFFQVLASITPEKEAARHRKGSLTKSIEEGALGIPCFWHLGRPHLNLRRPSPHRFRSMFEPQIYTRTATEGGKTKNFEKVQLFSFIIRLLPASAYCLPDVSHCKWHPGGGRSLRQALGRAARQNGSGSEIRFQEIESAARAVVPGCFDSNGNLQAIRVGCQISAGSEGAALRLRKGGQEIYTWGYK